MSWRIRKKDKTDKRHLLAFGVEPLLIVVFVGLLLTEVLPSLTQNPISLLPLSVFIMFSGLICLLFSKFSLHRRGICLSWGANLLTKSYARLHKIGHGLIAIGSVYLLAFLQFTHH